MPGTKSGGLKAKATNLAKNPNFYKDIGSKGGKAPTATPKGFAAMTPERLKEVSAKGGKISRRNKGEVKWTSTQ